MATTTRRTRSTGASSTNGSASSRKVSPQPRLGQTAPEIQKYGTLRQLPIALSAEARTESCQLLNEILADSLILYALYKKQHWLVAGPTFYQLHLLFDKHAEEQNELVDLLAERVQSLGGIAVGDPRHAAELTTIERTEELKDWGTNDLLMGDVLRRHELQVWFIAEHLVDVELVDR